MIDIIEIKRIPASDVHFMKKESFTTGILYMLISATGLSLTGFFGKLGMEQLTLTALVFWRFFAAFILYAILLWLMGRLKDGIGFENIKIHLLRTFFVLSAQYCFYYYLHKNTLLNAVVLLNTGPLFIPVIEWGILRNKVGRSSWVGIGVSFLGVLCVLQPDKGIFSLMSLIGLLAGLSQGASQVIFGITSKKERADLGVLYLFFACALFSLIPYLFVHSTFLEGNESIGSGIWILLFLGVASIGNQLSRAAAYQHSTASRLAPFLYFSVLLAGILDWIYFGKIPNALSIIGAGLVILGGLLKIYLRFKILQRK